MPTDNVTITVKSQCRRRDLDYALKENFEAELLKKTGLKSDDVSFAQNMYEITLRGLEGGKPSKKTYTGRSAEGIDAAIQDAMKGKIVDYDPTQISASLERTVQAPYFTVPVTSRSFNGEKLVNYHGDAVKELANTYGRRLKQDPDSIEYTVFLLREGYVDDGQIPKGQFEGVIAQESSKKSMDEALEKTRRIRLKKVKSIVYQQVVNMIVYGQQEKSAATVASVAAAASEVASQSSKGGSHARGCSPAASEPPQLTSSNYLM